MHIHTYIHTYTCPKGQEPRQKSHILEYIHAYIDAVIHAHVFAVILVHMVASQKNMMHTIAEPCMHTYMIHEQMQARNTPNRFIYICPCIHGCKHACIHE
jgi:hypothetical protein